MDYDVLVLGGGLIGCAVAYELSKYNLNIALIEKDYDIADDVSLINTSIIFDGIESKNSLTSKLESMGNNMMESMTEKFNVPFKRRSSLIFSENEGYLNEIYNRAKSKGVSGVSIVNKDEIKKIEPNIPSKYEKGIYTENTGLICPYDLALGYGEVAFDNNVHFKLEEEVLGIKKESKGFKVITTKNKFTCKIVINTTPNRNFSIDDEIDKEVQQNSKDENLKINYFAINKEIDTKYSNLIFDIDKNNEIILTLPTLNGETIGASVTKNNISNTKVLERLKPLVPIINSNYLTTFYTDTYHDKSFVIDDSAIDIGYIKIISKHYALVTMAPAIAKIVCETVVSNVNCIKRKDFMDKRREYYRFRDLSNKKRNEIIKLNPTYGKIICCCEKVTEGEIIDAIRRPLGARTLEGIKRRTGAALGKCQGAQCLNKVLLILARETNKPLTEIVKDSKNSNVLLNRIKEFDTM